METPRSMLFSPGNRLDLVSKAMRSGADAVIVDLEDAVPAGSKQEARENLQQLEESPVPLYIRTNGGDTEFLWDDIVAAGRARAAGIVLPKAEDADLIKRIDGALTAIEIECGDEPGSTTVIPMIESSKGVLDCRAIVGAAERVRSVMFGSGEQGDLVVDMGVEWTPDGTGLLAARSHVILSARAAGIEHPMDAVFMDFRNLDALRTECQLAKRVGYLGKVAIHPAQIPVIHEIFTPSEEEVAHSRRIIEAFDDALDAGSASINVDGRMVDYAVARMARSVLARAEAAHRAQD